MKFYPTASIGKVTKYQILIFLIVTDLIEKVQFKCQENWNWQKQEKIKVTNAIFWRTRDLNYFLRWQVRGKGSKADFEGC